jgi:hypothetical protein
MAAAGWLVRGLIWIEDLIPRRINGRVLPVMEIPIVADGFGAAACEALFGESDLLRGTGLPEDVRCTATVIALEEARRRGSAGVAIKAVIIDVIFAGDAMRMPTGEFCHGLPPCDKAAMTPVIRQ